MMECVQAQDAEDSAAQFGSAETVDIDKVENSLQI